MLWNNSDGNGAVDLWTSSGLTADLTVHYTYGPYPGWSAKALAAGNDSIPRILWTNTDGSAALWRVDSSGGFTQMTYGPYPGWTAQGLAVGADNVPRLLWTKTDRTMALWRVAADGSFTQSQYGPYPGYTASLIAVGANNIPRILWNKTDGSISVWNGLDGTAGYSHTEYGPYPGYTALSMAADGSSAVRLLWNHPSDNTISLWNMPSGGGYTFQNYPNPAGYFPVGATADNYIGYAEVLYAQPDSTSVVRYIQPNGSIQLDYAVAPPGASTGGGGGSTGTATPNPHGSYSVVYTYDPGSSSSTGGSGGVGPLTTSTDTSYGGTVASAGVSVNDPPGRSVSVRFRGTFKASFTWHGDAAHPNSPPPAQVTVIKRCSASWSTYSSSTSSVTGTCNTTYGQSQSGAAPPVSSGSVMGYASEVKGGATFNVTCSPLADSSEADMGGTTSASASATFAAAAVVMNLAGTTADTKGVDNILIGQNCTPTLNGIPYGQDGKPSVGTVTYAWKASGTRYKSWDVAYTAGIPKKNATPTTPPVPAVPPTSTSTAPTPLPATTTDAMPTWYWNENIISPATNVETVTCTATVTPPPGQGAAFTLTFPTQSVVVQVPAWTATGHGGNMQVNASDPVLNGYVLYAGPTPNITETGGIYWKAKVDPPPNTLFGKGKLILVQTVKPHQVYTVKYSATLSSTFTWSANDKTWLDTHTTYPWGSPAPPDYPYYYGGDFPGVQVATNAVPSAYDVDTITLTDHFDDYLMYIAPGNAQAVPIAHFAWDTNANNVVKPSTSGGWSDYGTRSAGPVTISTGVTPGGTSLPGDPAQPFEAWHDYPTWTQVVDADFSEYIKTTP